MFSFENPATDIPAEVLLDTSFVVEALIPRQPLHGAAVEFLLRLEAAEVRIRYSALMELELAETAFQIALKERHKKRWKHNRHDGRVRPRAGRLMAEASAAWEELISYFDTSRVEIDAAIPDVPALMTDFGLASYDAVHAATALRPTPVPIVTTDIGFASLPEADVRVITDSSRLARGRELRSKRR